MKILGKDREMSNWWVKALAAIALLALVAYGLVSPIEAGYYHCNCYDYGSAGVRGIGDGVARGWYLPNGKIYVVSAVRGYHDLPGKTLWGRR